MSLTLCALLLSPLGQVAADQDAAAANKASLERMGADLSALEFTTATRPPRKLTVSGNPALRWNYPIRNVDDAALFVCLGEERPDAVVTVMSYRDAKGNLRRAYEFLSISQDPLEVRKDEARIWRPDKPGFAWRELPKAPPPARTPAERKRQMHELAAKFLVSVRSGDNRYELRFLSQPLHRYQNPQADILDGCLFAFVEGTDPELILALESSAEKPGWKFASGRLTRFAIEIQFDGAVTREIPEMTGSGQLSDVYYIPDAGPLEPVGKAGEKP
jgi:hypothetical protein